MASCSCPFYGADISHCCCFAISAAAYCCSFARMPRCSIIGRSRSSTFLLRARCWRSARTSPLLLVSFVVFYILGAVDVPRDLPMFYLGYFFMVWWAVAIALIIGALSERTDWVQQIWIPYSYLYMMFSGFFYLADWLPPGVRTVALYQPYTQAYEMIRAGVFGTTVRTYGDPMYTTCVLAVLTLLGLWLLREGRRYVVAE